MPKNPAMHEVSPEQLECWLDDGTAVLVDVREDFEHATERIGGAHHAALSKLDLEALRARYPDKRIVFHCRTGGRSSQAAQRLGSQEGECFHLAGGIEAWKASGRATVRAPNAPRLDVMRQVQITAGSLVLLGVVLGAFVTPWALILSAFVGAGLVFAGASGWCGMAMLLSHMPWNKVRPACPGTTISSNTPPSDAVASDALERSPA
ncbi:MAG: rhodanese-like domain-containing protein [Phycisphaerales bacterium]